MIDCILMDAPLIRIRRRRRPQHDRNYPLFIAVNQSHYLQSLGTTWQAFTFSSQPLSSPRVSNFVDQNVKNQHKKLNQPGLEWQLVKSFLRHLSPLWHWPQCEQAIETIFGTENLFLVAVHFCKNINNYEKRPIWNTSQMLFLINNKNA